MRPLPLAIYRAATDAAALPLRLYLRRRLARGKEDGERLAERLGRARRPRPEGPLVWIHGASVGESVSAIPLIESLLRQRPDVSILVTTGTVTSAAILAQRLPAGVIHQYVPVDRAAWAGAFLDHWKPDAVLWLESDLWPNLLAAVRQRGIPATLVNARMSDRSSARWLRWAPGSARWLLSAFARCLAQSETDAERFRRLGAKDVACLGNLKASAEPLPVDEGELARLRRILGKRPLWLAASTHDGEEALAGRVHRRLDRSDLLTVIVPRHPPRAAAIAAALAADGLVVARRSLGEAPRPETQVYLVDTMGELGLLYRLAGIALVGKSLLGTGGQNPFEPARLGCAVLFGPHMENFSEAAAALVSCGGAIEVADEAPLAATLARLLDDPAECHRRGEAARAYAEAQAGAAERVLAAIGPLLPQR